MVKKNSIKVNYIFNAGYQIFALLVPLLTTPYISRVLEADGIGIYSYTYSMVRYFWLFSMLGISTYGVRRIGINQENDYERSKCFWEILIVKLTLALMAICVYIIYVYLFASNKIIACLQGIYLLAVGIDISYFFQGMENFKKISIRNFLVKLINIIYIFIFIKTKNDLWKYTLGLSLFTLIGNLSMWLSIRKYIKKVKISKLKPFKDFNVILQLFIPTIASQLYAVLDKSMIGWITKNYSENGYYEQALKIIEMSLVLITTLSAVMIPKISRAFKENKKDEVIGNLTIAYRFVWILGTPMMFGIMGISNVLVPVFFGNGYDKVELLLPILSLLFILMGLNYTTGTLYLISTNQQKIYNKNLLIGGFFNIILNFILINWKASIGAAIATVIGELIILVLCLKYLYDTSQYDIKIIFKISKKYIIAGIVMFIVINILKKHLYNTMLNLMLLILVGGITYIIVLFFEKEMFIQEIFGKIKPKLKFI